MSVAKMTVFAGALALLGAFATGGMAQSVYVANAQSTQTLQPTPVGTATSNGAVLVSMNYCTVVMNTQCQLSVMASASAPPSEAPGSSSSVGTTSPATEALPTTTGFYPSSSAAVSTETSASTETQSSYGSEVTEPATTATQPSSTGASAVTTTAMTAAAAGIKVIPGTVLGVAVLAVALIV